MEETDFLLNLTEIYQTMTVVYLAIILIADIYVIGFRLHFKLD